MKIPLKYKRKLGILSLNHEISSWKVISESDFNENSIKKLKKNY